MTEIKRNGDAITIVLTLENGIIVKHELTLELARELAERMLEEADGMAVLP